MNFKLFFFILPSIFFQILHVSNEYSLGRGVSFWWHVRTNCIVFSCTSNGHLFTYRRTVGTTLALLIAYL